MSKNCKLRVIQWISWGIGLLIAISVVVPAGQYALAVNIGIVGMWGLAAAMVVFLFTAFGIADHFERLRQNELEAQQKERERNAIAALGRIIENSRKQKHVLHVLNGC